MRKEEIIGRYIFIRFREQMLHFVQEQVAEGRVRCQETAPKEAAFALV